MKKVPKSKSYFHYNKSLKPLAKHFRNAFTKGEIMLWMYVLRARQLKGYQFFRQRTVSNYISDFFCKELNLIIEVDGITHLEKSNKDKLKDKNLRELGYHVFRIKDYDIMDSITSLLIALQNSVLLIII